MFELLNRIKPVNLLHLPQVPDRESSVALWLSELYRVKRLLEELTGKQVTDEILRETISLYNELRKVTRQVFELNRGDIPLLSGIEMVSLLDSAGFEVDIQGAIDRIKEGIEYATRRGGIQARKRILLTGCPNTSKKVLNCIENFANVIVMENCGGYKTVVDLTNEEGDTMEAIARASLKIACPCMSPNQRRFTLLSDLIEEYSIEGVIDLTWQACHTYNVESFALKDYIQAGMGIPFLQIETDYSGNDLGWLGVRVESFIEML
jgi:benzoyl-CoA reductase/2-hydroxyglutaryl-CoA dehydratase subunit BcrC/BadD/HgdB